jgi:excisionase family DNA binding protein
MSIEVVGLKIVRWVMQETTQDTQPLLLTVPQAAKLLNLGRTKVYELIGTKQLPVVRFGRAVRVSSASLKRWVEQQERQDLTA